MKNVKLRPMQEALRIATKIEETITCHNITFLAQTTTATLQFLKEYAEEQSKAIEDITADEMIEYFRELELRQGRQERAMNKGSAT